MDPLDNQWNVVTFCSWLLALIIDAQQTLQLPQDEDHDDDEMCMPFNCEDAPVFDAFAFMESSLYNYRFCFSTFHFPDDVRYWVKPRSTTWFSRFLVEQYDNSRWISMFRFTKPAVFNLAHLLKGTVEKKNTKYRLAIPVLVRFACTLFKLTHGANLTICSKMFAIGRNTVCKVLREVVHAINDNFKQEISWPTGERLRETQMKFATLCSLPSVVGAIDGMQVSISKPDFGAADYFYFKTGGYSVNCQAVVDSDKRFLVLYVGMPGSTNDSRMLRRSSLHYLASHGELLNATQSMEGHSPYLLGDLDYPLLPWLMVPHQGGSQLSLAEALFNKKLRRCRCVVENAFGILKQSFRELLNKTELHLTFIPDVIVCCAILHNILLRQSHEEVETWLETLHSEGLTAGTNDGDGPTREAVEAVGVVNDDVATQMGADKRNELGIFLTTRRRVQQAAH